jgi:hypothetical protein
MACTHTHTHRERERDPYPLAMPTLCGAQIYFYTQQPELMLFMLVTYVFFLCARPSFSFDSSHRQHLFPPPLLQKHHTRRTVAKRCVKITHTKKKWLFQKGERWYGESESTTTSLCVKIQKGGGGSQQTKRVKRKVISFLFWWWCYVETASPDEKSLASLSQYE